MREAITSYRDAVLEYVERCRKFWIIQPNTMVGRGISIIPLGILLSALQGEDHAAEAMASLSVTIAFNANIQPQFKIIQKILKRLV